MRQYNVKVVMDTSQHIYRAMGVMHIVVDYPEKPK